MKEQLRAEEMADLSKLPLFRPYCRAHYEGSIDKKGGNADWDWWLYQDEKGEWVIFDHIGPGCIYNFVQHRYPDSEEPVFRFYFDDENTPRFTIKHSQFGEVYPFTEPLASRYIGPYDNGRGPIRVVRSFVPMPYEKSCRITSSVKLEGFERAKGEGGWGHVIYHSYEGALPEGFHTFSPEDDYGSLTELWDNASSPPPAAREAEVCVHTAFVLKKGEDRLLFSDENAGMICGIRIRTQEFQQGYLKDLEIRIRFDGHETEDVQAGFGCFFGNELGYHGVRYLLLGMDTDGSFYQYFPMPYARSAQITISNHGEREIPFLSAEVLYTRAYNALYEKREWGYFRSSPYYIRKHTEGSDSILAETRGCGHIVGAVITAFGRTPESRADCEGDVRVMLDGIRTPQIESDGSESYSCYGWGFETPREGNPASGYDGRMHRNWSMVRTMMGDVYPFLSGFRFGIESGGNNDLYMEHSGMIFYYGRDEERLKSLGKFCVGDLGAREFGYYVQGGTKETLVSYFEGDEDDVEISITGRRDMDLSGFSFIMPEEAEYVILRRVSDQGLGKQKAAVKINGMLLEKPWYFADYNPYKRWLEDEYTLPEEVLRKGEKNQVELRPDRTGGDCVWNEFSYEILAVMKTDAVNGGQRNELGQII